MIKERKYEVIKFVEHNGKCRIVMDCIPGRLLVYRMQDADGPAKDEVFRWFGMLAGELEKYHRCKRDQCYRYLNPYSVLVTAENKIFLLDLSAESNGFVLQNMQKPAMREHFVKPVIHIKENTRLSMDLYSLGKTMQFILARAEPVITLSRREEYLLSGIIEKCLGENPKKKYVNLKEVLKELPKVSSKKYEIQKKQKKSVLIIGAIVVLLTAVWAGKALACKDTVEESGREAIEEPIYR